MKKNKLSGLMAALALALFIGCGKDDDTFPDYYNSIDNDFMIKATYINKGEVDAGNIALQRALHPGVKDFGTVMITDHNAAQAALEYLVTPRGKTLPSETDQEHKDMAATLMSLTGDAFDSTYLYMMIAGHNKAIALHQNEIQNGYDELLKKYATDKLAIIQHHRMVADSLAHALYP
jgi:putative membrane protein